MKTDIVTEVCPYCRSKFVPEDEPVVCEGCGTSHHVDCYAENGGCTIFGCSKAPGDELQVTVLRAGTELKLKVAIHDVR